MTCLPSSLTPDHIGVLTGSLEPVLLAYLQHSTPGFLMPPDYREGALVEQDDYSCEYARAGREVPYYVLVRKLDASLTDLALDPHPNMRWAGTVRVVPHDPFEGWSSEPEPFKVESFADAYLRSFMVPLPQLSDIRNEHLYYHGEA